MSFIAAKFFMKICFQIETRESAIVRMRELKIVKISFSSKFRKNLMLHLIFPILFYAMDGMKILFLEM